MNKRGVIGRIGGLLSLSILGLVHVAALVLAPFRLGRLLRTVSIPRLHEHPTRTALTVFGIALGVAVVIAVALVNRSILGSVASTFERIGGRADLQVSAGSSGFAESLFDTIRETPGVAKATPTLHQTVVLRDSRAAGEHLLLLGVDLLGEDDGYFRDYASDELPAIRADPLAFLNSTHNIIITHALADRFGYRLHDLIPLATPHGLVQFEIWGFIGNRGIGRAFGGLLAVMDYQAMQVAFERGSNLDGVDIALTREKDAGAVARALRVKLGSGFAVERPEHKNEHVAKMLVGMRTGLTVGSLIAMLVGMFLIYNTMSISVVQRKRELGILRALGTTRRELLQLLTLEGALLGTVGALLGLLLGLGLGRVLLQRVSSSVSELYAQISAPDLRLDHMLIGGSMALGVLTTTLASAVPARKASRMSPIEVLRTGALTSVAPPRARVTKIDLAAVLCIGLAPVLVRFGPWHGIPLGPLLACEALLAAGALLMPRLVQLLHAALSPLARRAFGVEAQLATDNLLRDLGRSAATAAALMLGVAMATAFAVFVGSFVSSALEWIDRSVPADLFVTSSARFGGRTNAPMIDGLEHEFGALAGVDAVERARVIDARFRDVPIAILSTDTAIFERRSRITMLEGKQDEALRKLREGEVMLSENFSRRFALHAGDRLELSTREGTKSFRVAGVDIDYTSDLGTVLLDRQVYTRLWGDELVDTYKVYLRPGADPLAVRRAIDRKYGETFKLFVLTNREFKGEILHLLDQVFAVMHALEAVALIIAVLGVVNALFASVLDRVREIGVLRAVGMLRRQTRKMILVEGALIGVVGTIGGVLVGALIGQILLEYINLVETGWYFPYRPSWGSIAESGLAVVAVSAVAAFYPARQAAALVVSDALDYE